MIQEVCSANSALAFAYTTDRLSFCPLVFQRAKSDLPLFGESVAPDSELFATNTLHIVQVYKRAGYKHPCGTSVLLSRPLDAQITNN